MTNSDAYRCWDERMWRFRSTVDGAGCRRSSASGLSCAPQSLDPANGTPPVHVGGSTATQNRLFFVPKNQLTGGPGITEERRRARQSVRVQPISVSFPKLYRIVTMCFAGRSLVVARLKGG